MTWNWGCLVVVHRTKGTLIGSMLCRCVNMYHLISIVPDGFHVFPEKVDPGRHPEVS
jgi:hypothetical protein